MADRLVLALAAEWLDSREEVEEEEEREACDMAWDRTIVMATRAAWVVARRAALVTWMSMVAAWAAQWYPMVYFVS
jgi:chorismate-pyruvate lyase